MPLQLGTATKDDLPAILEMLFRSYDQTSAFVNAVYPHELTEHGIQGLDMAVSRLQYLIAIDKSIRWYKVTDTDTGEIVSASQWNVYDREKPAEVVLDGPPGSWANEGDKRYAVEMFEGFVGPRYKRYGEVDLPIVCLNIMGTAKKYRYRGAATMQVEEMNRAADGINALMTTESTTEARWLYEKNGFVVSKDPGHWTIEAKSEEFAARPKERLFFMERPRAR